MIPLLLLFMLFTVTSCTASRGFDRQALKDLLRADPDVVTERDIAAVLDLQPELPSPFRLALYFTTDQVPFRSSIQKANWLTLDKEAILNKLRPLTEEGIVKTAFVLADSTVQGTLNRDIRLAAARYNADVLMIVSGGGLHRSVQQRACRLVCHDPRRLSGPWHPERRPVHDGRNRLGCAYRLPVRHADRGRDGAIDRTGRLIG